MTAVVMRVMMIVFGGDGAQHEIQDGDFDECDVDDDGGDDDDCLVDDCGDYACGCDDADD